MESMDLESEVARLINIEDRLREEEKQKLEAKGKLKEAHIRIEELENRLLLYRKKQPCD